MCDQCRKRNGGGGDKKEPTCGRCTRLNMNCTYEVSVATQERSRKVLQAKQEAEAVKIREREAASQELQGAVYGQEPVAQGPQGPVYASGPVAQGPQGPVYAPGPSGSRRESESTSRRRPREGSTPSDESRKHRHRRP